MKIDMQSQAPVYRKKAGPGNAASQARTIADGRRDVVDIHHGATATDKEMVTLKASIHNYVNTPSAGERLSELQSQVRSSSYDLPTQQIVGAMLKFL